MRWSACGLEGGWFVGGPDSFWRCWRWSSAGPFSSRHLPSGRRRELTRHMVRQAPPSTRMSYGPWPARSVRFLRRMRTRSSNGSVHGPPIVINDRHLTAALSEYIDYTTTIGPIAARAIHHSRQLIDSYRREPVRTGANDGGAETSLLYSRRTPTNGRELPDSTFLNRVSEVRVLPGALPSEYKIGS